MPAQFADAIHAEFPDQMLAYNLSPSFNWDTTGMTDDEMRAFPEELGKMGFVFNFITYGGHQIDGVASEEFATTCARTACWRWRGCSARCASSSRPTARRRPWSADRAATRRWPPPPAAPRPPRRWARAPPSISTSCRPRCRRSCSRSGWRCGATTTSSARSCGCSYVRGAPGPTCSSSGIYGDGDEPLANVVVDPIKDRHGRSILTVRDQNTFAEKLRQKRLMDSDPPLADPPLQGRDRVLRDAHRGQHLPDRKDEVARHLQRRLPGGRRDHRRRREPAAHRRAADVRSRRAEAADRKED